MSLAGQGLLVVPRPDGRARCGRWVRVVIGEEPARVVSCERCAGHLADGRDAGAYHLGRVRGFGPIIWCNGELVDLAFDHDGRPRRVR